MNEAVFAGEIKRSLLHIWPNGFYMKIPDSFGNAPGDGSNTRFTPPKYLDAIFFVNQQFFGFEYKQHRSSGAFPFSKVRPIQEEALSTIFNNGGHAYFVINIRYTKESRVNVAVFVPIVEWLALKEQFSYRKSIPLNALYDPLSATIGERSPFPALSTERIDGKTIWPMEVIIH